MFRFVVTVEFVIPAHGRAEDKFLLRNSVEYMLKEYRHSYLPETGAKKGRAVVLSVDSLGGVYEDSV